MNARFAAFVLAALLTVAHAGAALGGSPVPPDGPEKPKHTALVGAEAAGWLTTLRAASDADLGHERLVVLGPDGTVIARAEGTATNVPIPVEATRWLRSDDASVSIVHNHPGNTSLSKPDLVLLALPGVLRIVAVGNDGSLYEAARGRNFDARTFEARVEQERVVLKRKLTDATSGIVMVDDRIMTHFAHALALRLARLHLIEYRAELDAERERAWYAVRMWYLRADR